MKKENVHAGHRERMRQRYREHGLENFADHEVLELLLYYTIPRGDVNGVAHRLLERFGSIAGVLDAPERELKKITGIGDSSALFLHLLPEVFRRYNRPSERIQIHSLAEAGEYFEKYYEGIGCEQLVLMMLDNKMQVIALRVLSTGAPDRVQVDTRRLMELVLSDNAVQVIIAHNHPHGRSMPSRADLETTITIRRSLETIHVQLLDHIVVGDDGYYSFTKNHCLK